MDPKPEGRIERREPGKENGGTVPGIYFEVEQDLKVIQDCIINVVRFINDDDWCFSFFNRKAGDFFLDGPEVVRLTEPRLSSQFGYQVPVKIVRRQGGKAGVYNLVKGRVQASSPVADRSRLTPAGASRTKCFCNPWTL